MDLCPAAVRSAKERVTERERRGGNLRLDARDILAIGKVHVRSINTNVQVLDNGVMRLQLGRQVLIIHGDNAGHFGKVIADFNRLDFAKRHRDAWRVSQCLCLG